MKRDSETHINAHTHTQTHGHKRAAEIINKIAELDLSAAVFCWLCSLLLSSHNRMRASEEAGGFVIVKL